MDPGRAADEAPLPLWRVLEDEFRELHVTGTEPEWRRHCESELARVAAEAPGPASRPEQLEAAIHRLVHQLPDDLARSALCLSGGGIRSASFGLGVVQG